MIDEDKRQQRFESKEKTRRRMHAVIDEENYEQAAIVRDEIKKLKEGAI